MKKLSEIWRISPYEMTIARYHNDEELLVKLMIDRKKKEGRILAYYPKHGTWTINMHIVKKCIPPSEFILLQSLVAEATEMKERILKDGKH